MFCLKYYLLSGFQFYNPEFIYMHTYKYIFSGLPSAAYIPILMHEFTQIEFNSNTKCKTHYKLKANKFHDCSKFPQVESYILNPFFANKTLERHPPHILRNTYASEMIEDTKIENLLHYTTYYSSIN